MKQHLQKVSVQVRAIEKGQHGGSLKESGEKFVFNGNLVNGEFPKWVKPVEKIESEFSKLSPSEQDEFKKGKGKIFDAEAMRKELEREVRAEIEKEERAKLKEQIRQEMLAEMNGSKPAAPAESADQGDKKLTPKQELLKEAQELGLQVTERNTADQLKEMVAEAKAGNSIV